MEKGNDDGLYISSVACCQELWALIMDAGTGFSAQVPSRCIAGLHHDRWWQVTPCRVVGSQIHLLQLRLGSRGVQTAACCFTVRNTCHDL